MTENSPRINIAKYDDYRDFLKERFEEEKAHRKLFSYQYCGNHLGTSKVYLKLLLEKKRHTTMSKLPKLWKLFSMNAFERQYFTILFLCGTAESPELKTYFQNVLKALQGSEVYESVEFKAKARPEKSVDLFQNWLKMAIDALGNFEDFTPDPSWIQERLLGDLDKTEIQKALDDLIADKVLVKVGDRWKTRDFTFRTGSGYDLEGFKIYKVGLARMFEVVDDVSTFKPCSFHMMSISLAEGQEIEMFRLFKEFRDQVIRMSQSSTGRNKTVYLISNNIAALSK